jgi:hypothetical protein
MRYKENHKLLLVSLGEVLHAISNEVRKYHRIYRENKLRLRKKILK